MRILIAPHIFLTTGREATEKHKDHPTSNPGVSGFTYHHGFIYSNYIFNKLFLISNNESVAGYIVVIDANNTQYAVLFNAADNFLKSETILLILPENNEGP